MLSSLPNLLSRFALAVAGFVCIWGCLPPPETSLCQAGGDRPGKELQRVPNVKFGTHSDEVWAVAFSPDGKFLVTGGKDGVISIWDAPTSEGVKDGCVRTAFNHPIRRLVVSCDGSL